MQNNRNVKYKILARALFCLLAFSLLGGLLPTALSFEMQSRVIGSLGAVTYSPSATLLVTDSTPEGPVPYTIDGQSGYDTGWNSYYTISAGVHTIKLPSPYTSPISNITYYFSYWQDDSSTDNPRTVTLASNENRSLHGVYSTSPEPPPPPPPPLPPSGDYLAYNGWETGGVTTWDDGSLPNTYANTPNGYASVVSTESKTGSQSMEFANTGGSRAEYKYSSSVRYAGGTGLWGYPEVYISAWFKLRSDFDMSRPGEAWCQFYELREYGSMGSLNIYLQQPEGQPERMRWRFFYTTNVYVEQYQWFHWDVGWNEGDCGGGNQAGSTVDYTPHGVPIGRWFQLEVYVYRHPTNGIFRIWITDPEHPDPSRTSTKILFSIENARTMQDTEDTDHIEINNPKLYSFGDHYEYTFPNVLWTDELYVYNYNAHEG